MAQGARVVAVGVAITLIAALAATRPVAAHLFGVAPVDAPTFAAMAVLMLAIGAVAAYVPARRASRVDPCQSLRSDTPAGNRLLRSNSYIADSRPKESDSDWVLGIPRKLRGVVPENRGRRARPNSCLVAIAAYRGARHGSAADPTGSSDRTRPPFHQHRRQSS